MITNHLIGRNDNKTIYYTWLYDGFKWKKHHLGQSSHENIPRTSRSVNSLALRANCCALSGAVVEGSILPPATLTKFAYRRLRLCRTSCRCSGVLPAPWRWRGASRLRMIIRGHNARVRRRGRRRHTPPSHDNSRALPACDGADAAATPTAQCRRHTTPSHDNSRAWPACDGGTPSGTTRPQA